MSKYGLMDNDEGTDHTGDDEIEEFSDEFKCCVCLDLFYKPVVLACGHISCFWCVFEAMDTWQESRCPVCRHSYNHFPSICRLLHVVLRKSYPLAYKRREMQVIEDEKNSGTFSPQFEEYLSETNPSNETNLNNSSLQSTTISVDKLQLQSCSVGEAEPSTVKDSSEAVVSNQDHSTTFPTSLSGEATINGAVQENNKFGSHDIDKTSKQMLITELLCVICKQLLYRPLVLNCGHVFCEACIINPCNKLCRCPVCQSMHPNGFPKVCLVLEHFFEEQFSEEYAARRLDVLQLGTCQYGSPSTCSSQDQQSGAQCSSSPTNDCSSDHGHGVHFGVGCDCCGMYPIIGERYKCKDCVEEIGFDLCEVCYNSSSKLPGRFNQQHTPEHIFEILEPMMTLLSPEDYVLYNPDFMIDLSQTPDVSHDEQQVPEVGRALGRDDTSDTEEVVEPSS